MKSKIISISNRLRRGLLLIAVTCLFNACSKDDDNTGSGSPGINEVWMQGNAFNPSTRTVTVNTTVTWTNKDGTNHTVTSNNGLFTSSGTIAGGGAFSYKFTAAGTYDYHCAFHSGMNGKITVQ